MQYELTLEKEAINNLIEKAICEADKKGAKVVSLGLLNQVRHLINIQIIQVNLSFKWKLNVYILPNTKAKKITNHPNELRLGEYIETGKQIK